jgi:hypothetical protein
MTDDPSRYDTSDGPLSTGLSQYESGPGINTLRNETTASGGGQGPEPDGGTAQVPGERSEHRPTPSAFAAARAVLGRLADAVEGASYRWVQASFAFVFFYFGLQKWPVVQGASPVRPPVKAFVEAVGFGGWIPLPPEVGLLFIGVYEVTLGTLWFTTMLEEWQFGTSRVFVLAGLMTVAHQTITFLPLVLVPDVAFRQTQFALPLLGSIPFSIALDWLSAFILKNLLFLGAFFYCLGEWAERYAPATSGSACDS